MWLYAVVEGTPRLALASTPRLPGAEAPPRVLPLGGDLSAIVADVPLVPYGEGTLQERADDVEWVGQCATAHHAVIERLARTRGVAPFRVLTIFEHEDRVVDALTPLAPRLRTTLSRVKDASEWVVRAFRPMKAKAPSAPPPPKAVSGTAFLRDRHLARQAERRDAETVAVEVLRMADALAEVATEHVRRETPAQGGALLDAAYLVPRGKVTTFRRTLTRASRELRDLGGRVTLTGPWPAYSFVATDEGDRA